MRAGARHREEVLSGMRIFSSESVVFHLVSRVSSLLCCFGLCLCLGLFCCFGRHLAFCFSPVLEQCENSWSKTKRFDDRQSLERARHELKKKRAGARFTVSSFIFQVVRYVWFGCVVLGGGLLFALLVLFPPSLDNSWIYPRSQAQGTMTATIVMMRAAMDQKKSEIGV